MINFQYHFIERKFCLIIGTILHQIFKSFYFLLSNKINLLFSLKTSKNSPLFPFSPRKSKFPSVMNIEAQVPMVQILI